MPTLYKKIIHPLIFATFVTQCSYSKSSYKYIKLQKWRKFHPILISYNEEKTETFD